MATNKQKMQVDKVEVYKNINTMKKYMYIYKYIYINIYPHYTFSNFLASGKNQIDCKGV